MKKLTIILSVLLIFFIGCDKSTHGTTINKPSRRGWDGELKGLYVDRVSILIDETSDGQAYVIIRGDIENTSTTKTFQDLSIGAELRTNDGRLGGEEHLRGPDTVFSLRPGERETFEIRIDNPARGSYDVIFNLRGGL